MHILIFLLRPQAQQLVAPTQESVDAVNAWLKENGIIAETISPSGDWLSFGVPVSKANKLFDADFSVFKHDDTGIEAVRTLSYSIPAELQGHLDLVHPTVTFPNPMGQLPVLQMPMPDISSVQNLSARAIASSCSSRVTPACLQAIYNIPTARATQSSNRLAVPGFIQEYANEADLKVCCSCYLPIVLLLIVSSSDRPSFRTTALTFHLAPHSRYRPSMAVLTPRTLAKLASSLILISSTLSASPLAFRPSLFLWV